MDHDPNVIADPFKILQLYQDRDKLTQYKACNIDAITGQQLGSLEKNTFFRAKLGWYVTCIMEGQQKAAAE